MYVFRLCALLSAALLLPLPSFGQETTPPEVVTEPAAEPTPAPASPSLQDQLGDAIESGGAKVKDLSTDVDADPRAREISAGILSPIYKLAEQLGFPAFHWIAFMLMVTGVVSFALQLVIGKLIVLTRLHLSFTEILGDALGLVISLIGLVLTTQAAAENSTFPQSPFAVLSSTLAGAVLGFIFYLWGQSQELKAARAARLLPRS